MNIYPNAYYNYKKQRTTAYHREKKRIQDKILEIYNKYSGIPGYRMMRIYLQRSDIYLSEVTVHKYMKELNLKSTIIPQKTTYKKGESYKRFKNHLNRNFYADSPNQKWCTDFTCIFMKDGSKRYNCSIMDLYDKFIVATKNGPHLDANLAIETLKLALELTEHPKELLLHSDQGSPYTSQAFTEYCEQNNITQSMSKAGCPYDNSPMERFYATFKSEFIQKQKFSTDEELNTKTYDYVYHYYNRIRPHSSNAYLTPFEKRNR